MVSFVRRNNLQSYRIHKSKRHAFAEALINNQASLDFAKIIKLAQKHGISIPEFLGDKTIPEKYKQVIERKIKNN